MSDDGLSENSDDIHLLGNSSNTNYNIRPIGPGLNNMIIPNAAAGPFYNPTGPIESTFTNPDYYPPPIMQFKPHIRRSLEVLHSMTSKIQHIKDEKIKQLNSHDRVHLGGLESLGENQIQNMNKERRNRKKRQIMRLEDLQKSRKAIMTQQVQYQHLNLRQPQNVTGPGPNPSGFDQQTSTTETQQQPDTIITNNDLNQPGTKRRLPNRDRLPHHPHRIMHDNMAQNLLNLTNNNIVAGEKLNLNEIDHTSSAEEDIVNDALKGLFGLDLQTSSGGGGAGQSLTRRITKIDEVQSPSDSSETELSATSGQDRYNKNQNSIKNKIRKSLNLSGRTSSMVPNTTSSDVTSSVRGSSQSDKTVSKTQTGRSHKTTRFSKHHDVHHLESESSESSQTVQSHHPRKPRRRSVQSHRRRSQIRSDQSYSSPSDTDHDAEDSDRQQQVKRHQQGATNRSRKNKHQKQNNAVNNYSQYSQNNFTGPHWQRAQSTGRNNPNFMQYQQQGHPQGPNLQFNPNQQLYNWQLQQQLQPGSPQLGQQQFRQQQPPSPTHQQLDWNAQRRLYHQRLQQQGSSKSKDPNRRLNRARNSRRFSTVSFASDLESYDDDYDNQRSSQQNVNHGTGSAQTVDKTQSDGSGKSRSQTHSEDGQDINDHDDKLSGTSSRKTSDSQQTGKNDGINDIGHDPQDHTTSESGDNKDSDGDIHQKYSKNDKSNSKQLSESDIANRTYNKNGKLWKYSSNWVHWSHQSLPKDKQHLPTWQARAHSQIHNMMWHCAMLFFLIIDIAISMSLFFGFELMIHPEEPYSVNDIHTVKDYLTGKHQGRAISLLIKGNQPGSCIILDHFKRMSKESDEEAKRNGISDNMEMVRYLDKEYRQYLSMDLEKLRQKCGKEYTKQIQQSDSESESESTKMNNSGSKSDSDSLKSKKSKNVRSDSKSQSDSKQFYKTKTLKELHLQLQKDEDDMFDQHQMSQQSLEDENLMRKVYKYSRVDIDHYHVSEFDSDIEIDQQDNFNNKQSGQRDRELVAHPETDADPTILNDDFWNNNRFKEIYAKNKMYYETTSDLLEDYNNNTKLKYQESDSEIQPSHTLSEIACGPWLEGAGLGGQKLKEMIIDSLDSSSWRTNVQWTLERLHTPYHHSYPELVPCQDHSHGHSLTSQLSISQHVNNGPESHDR